MSTLNEDQVKVLCIIRMVTASISIIASSAVVVMIARSAKKLSTTQNRLLTGLSVSDIISSFAMSFTSLPMPKDTPYVWMALGNTRTCEAQSFVFLLGAIVTPSYNAGICIIFLLKVRYGMSDSKIRTKVEPFLHGIPILTSLSFCVYCLKKEFFNPVGFTCYVSDYPRHCTLDPNVPCERGEGVHDNWIVKCGIYLISIIIPSVIFGTMTTLYITVRLQVRRMERYGIGSLTATHRSSRRISFSSLSQLRRDSSTAEQSRTDSSTAGRSRRGSASARQSRHVNMTMYRALAYSGAWLITYVMPLINYWQKTSKIHQGYLIPLLNTVFYPLQGFFNFIVFIYPKVILARQMNSEGSLCHAFCCAFKDKPCNNFFIRKRKRRHNGMIVRSVNGIVENEEFGESVDLPSNNVEIMAVKKENLKHDISQIEQSNSGLVDTVN